MLWCNFSGFAAPPSQPFQYPNIGGGVAPSPNIAAPPPFTYNIPPQPPQQYSPDAEEENVGISSELFK